MASGDLASFTQKMLSQGLFSCAICKQLLKTPVMAISEGNACQQCIQNQEIDVIKIPNVAFNTLLKEMKFPCKYVPQGCEDYILYENLQNHENKCLYREISCFIASEECLWEGRLIDISQHLIEDHPKHVITGPFDEFHFEYNLSKSLNVVKLLNNKNNRYIIRIKEAENGNVLFFLQNAKETNSDLRLNMKYRGKNSEYKITLHLLPLDASCDGNNGIQVRLATLKEISGDAENIEIIVKPKNYGIKNGNFEVLKQLECPVCTELMRPPIKQCPTGHSICTDCRKKVTSCPSCRISFKSPDIRNFSLEAFTPFVYYSCAYKQFGCMATFLEAETGCHEANCEYKKYTCPIDNCNKSGNYLSMRNHFKAHHSDLFLEGFVFNDYFTITNQHHSMVSGFPSTIIKYFFGNNNIFTYNFQHTNDSCIWWIQILNSKATLKMYYFEISINSSQFKGRRVSNSNLCINNDADATNYSVSFTHSDLKEHKNPDDQKISFKCEIFKLPQ